MRHPGRPDDHPSGMTTAAALPSESAGVNVVWAFLIALGVTAVTVTAMLAVRRRAPKGSHFSDGDRASGVFGVCCSASGSWCSSPRSHGSRPSHQFLRVEPAGSRGTALHSRRPQNLRRETRRAVRRLVRRPLVTTAAAATGAAPTPGVETRRAVRRATLRDGPSMVIPFDTAAVTGRRARRRPARLPPRRRRDQAPRDRAG
jgi:hypothetical protein